MGTAWGTFDRFLAGELPLEELMDCVAGTAALADLLAPDELRRLHRIDPTSSNAFRDATASVAAIYETHRPGRLVLDRAERIARGMLAGEIDCAAGTQRSHGSASKAPIGFPTRSPDSPPPSTLYRSPPPTRCAMPPGSQRASPRRSISGGGCERPHWSRRADCSTA